jgi:hypothetical protein
MNALEIDARTGRTVARGAAQPSYLTVGARVALELSRRAFMAVKSWLALSTVFSFLC